MGVFNEDSERVAVVTGGGQGIGEGIVRRLVNDGCHVVILDKDEEPAASLAKEIGAVAFCADVSKADDVRRIAGEIGPIDILVNNAGMAYFEDVLSSSDEHLYDVVSVNILGMLHCCRAFVPGMFKRGGGSIVNISSGSVPAAAYGFGIYPGTKAAVETLTRQLAGEWGRQGVRINCIGPGAIQTQRNASRFEGESRERRRAAIPLGRTGLPSDIAGVVSALCSSDMGYVTGQIIYVDGGLGSGRPGV